MELLSLLCSDLPEPFGKAVPALLEEEEDGAPHSVHAEGTSLVPGGDPGTPQCGGQTLCRASSANQAVPNDRSDMANAINEQRASF